MELSSPRFKAITVTVGFSFWFFIISSTLGFFSLEIFAIFVAIVLFITQIFSYKLSKGLDAFATINTKIFLGLLFVGLISLYGIFFRILRIDLLRLKKSNQTYWLDMETSTNPQIFKQY